MALTQSDIHKFENIVENKLDEKLEEKFNDKFRFLPSKDLFLGWMDKLMGELNKIREQQEILTGRASEHSDKLENHETRIEKLEKHFPSSL